MENDKKVQRVKLSSILFMTHMASLPRGALLCVRCRWDVHAVLDRLCFSHCPEQETEALNERRDQPATEEKGVVNSSDSPSDPSDSPSLTKGVPATAPHQQISRHKMHFGIRNVSIRGERGGKHLLHCTRMDHVARAGTQRRTQPQSKSSAHSSAMAPSLLGLAPADFPCRL